MIRGRTGGGPGGWVVGVRKTTPSLGTLPSRRAGYTRLSNHGSTKAAAAPPDGV